MAKKVLKKLFSTKRNPIVRQLKHFTSKIIPNKKRYVRRKKLETEKSLICFVGAPWTLLVYMLDLKKGKKLAHKLKEDKDFYNHCVQQGQENYKKHFAEEKFLTTVNNIFKKHYSIKYGSL